MQNLGLNLQPSEYNRISEGRQTFARFTNINVAEGDEITIYYGGETSNKPKPSLVFTAGWIVTHIEVLTWQIVSLIPVKKESEKVDENEKD